MAIVGKRIQESKQQQRGFQMVELLRYRELELCHYFLRLCKLLSESNASSVSGARSEFRCFIESIQWGKKASILDIHSILTCGSWFQNPHVMDTASDMPGIQMRRICQFQK